MQRVSTSARSLGTLVLALALGASGALAQQSNTGAANSEARGKPVQDRYIVVLKENRGNPGNSATAVMNGTGGQIHHVYSNVIHGFAASIPAQALNGLRNNPNVDYIEQDLTVSTNEAPLPATLTQSPATWGLDRIDQATGLDNSYSRNYSGAGVYAFIIDTGILPNHVEFAGRVLGGATTIIDGRGSTDCNGHGTHVAGTVGGTVYGVAKSVTLIPVRVLDCKGSGTNSGVIAGIDWAAAPAQAAMRPAVANMSLGGGASAALDTSVANAVKAGITMVVAAGNENTSACNSSPARAPTAITVGATTNTDARASFSNFGTCVDIFAPGVNITSSWNTSSTATNTISGTSMATPHVTGVAALALAANPSASPTAVVNFLVANAWSGKVTSPGTGSPNKLLYALAPGAPQEATLTSVSVKSLTGTGVKVAPKWRADFVVTTGDSTNSYAVVAGATVSGSFSTGGTGSCVTNAAGACTITSATFSPSTAATTLTITNVSGSNLAYFAAGNAANAKTVSKP